MELIFGSPNVRTHFGIAFRNGSQLTNSNEVIKPDFIISHACVPLTSIRLGKMVKNMTTLIRQIRTHKKSGQLQLKLKAHKKSIKRKPTDALEPLHT